MTRDKEAHHALTHSLHILEARTPWQRLVGLLGRPPLPAATALRLSPCRAVHSVGMRHAIDVVFVDRRDIVCAIRAPLRPWRAAWCLRAHAVLELRAGEVAALGIEPGTKLAQCTHAAQAVQAAQATRATQATQATQPDDHRTSSRSSNGGGQAG
jgi:uncharacterized membrane protein (UPF0127 family)